MLIRAGKNDDGAVLVAHAVSQMGYQRSLLVGLHLRDISIDSRAVERSLYS